MWSRFVKWLNTPCRIKPVFVFTAIFMIILVFISTAFIYPGVRKMVTTGEFGQASFDSLKELSYTWEELGDQGRGRVADEVLPAPETAAQERKIIYNAALTLETGDPDKVYAFAADHVKEQDGYIAGSRRWVDEDERLHIQMNLRLPVAFLEETLAFFGGLGKIINQSLTGSDVTEQYYDLESRLRNKMQQEERYLEILQTATAVEDVLKVERELERIRGEIESMEGRFRYLADRTELASINLLFREPAGPGIAGFKPGNLLRDFAAVFWASIRFLLLFFSGVLPWAAILVLGLYIYTRRKKRLP